jgi:hypothetical protein
MEGCFIDSRLKMARGFYLLSFTVTQSLTARAGVMHSQLLGRVGIGNISRPEAAIAIYCKISLLLVIKYQWIVNASLSRYRRHPYLDAYGNGYF